ncbi:unnamed protein product [Camellia sinensis]
MYLVCGMKRNKFTATERDRISFVLDRAFVHLEAWFQWFNTTQLGKDMSSYFGHGRDNATMRELNPKNCMHSISKLLPKEHELGKEYDSTAKLLSNFEILNQMHFDDAHGTYLDFGNHTEKVPRPGSFRIAKIEICSLYSLCLPFPICENGPYRDKAKIIYNDLRSNLIM